MFNKLRLRPEMKKTWLIQRLEKPWRKNGEVVTNPFSFGGGLKNGGLSEEAMELLRDIMAFDYMGSAEFEFGAVPEAFRFLAGQASQGNVTIGSLTLDGREVFYLCPTQYENGVRNIVSLIYADEYQFGLKEGCWLRESLEEKEYHKKYIGWLELDNGFVFFKDKEMFEQVANLFGVSVKSNT